MTTPRKKVTPQAAPASGEVGLLDAVGTAPAPVVAPALEGQHPVHPILNEIEEIALFWGGDVGTKLRNLVGKARELI